MRKAKARAKIDISKHLGLVYPHARRYADNGVALEDLVQEGCLGLHTAAEKFDPSKGFQFATYAQWWIRAHIQRAWHRLRRTVHYATRSSTQTPSEVRLDKPVAADAVGNVDALVDTLVSHDVPQDEQLSAAERAARVNAAIATLNPRERQIIRMRFVDEMALEDIGDVFGLTRERIRQLQEVALRKLRARLLVPLDESGATTREPPKKQRMRRVGAR